MTEVVCSAAGHNKRRKQLHRRGYGQLKCLGGTGRLALVSSVGRSVLEGEVGGGEEHAGRFDRKAKGPKHIINV